LKRVVTHGEKAPGLPMKTVQEYRQHAEECRKLAKLAAEGVVREQLLKMAEMWERSAEEREAALRLDHREASPTRSLNDDG
jgi:hypothetical protein